MSLFILIAISMVLTASEVKEKEKKSGCTGAAVEKTQTEAVRKSCCRKPAEVKTIRASGCTGEVKAITNSHVSGCASKCARTKAQAVSAPVECNRVPPGVGSQRTENR